MKDGKVKVPCHERIWRVEEKILSFLTLALDGGEWPVLRCGCFTPKEPPVLIG
jgi:hypothetical protein